MKDETIYLRHILECIRRVEANVAGGREQFMASHSGFQLNDEQSPACVNQPRASAAVMAALASAMAYSRRSSVRAAVARKSAVTFDHHASLGDKSGESGGRERRRAPGVAMAWAMPATLWAVR
jgi:hypothetical protein